MGGKSLRIAIASPRWPGTRTQCMALATGLASRLEALGFATQIHAMSGFARLRARMGILSPLKSPYVIISCGTVGEARARELRRIQSCAVWIHVDPPLDAGDGPNLVFVPSTDWDERFDKRPEYVLLEGVPHQVRKDEIDARRSAARRRLGLRDSERAVAFLIGGPSPAFNYDAEVLERISASINAVKDAGAPIIASCSRRTTPEIREVVERAIVDRRRFYASKGPNPYLDFLAAADELVVSEDSITMCCEGLATGKLVRLLRLAPREGERLQKVREFQRRMQDLHHVLPYFDGSNPVRPVGAVVNDTERAVEIAFDAVRRALHF